MKIDKLTLKNFKFFYGEKILNFEGKNVLLYGENGSGKSSIYWALYTLLNNGKSSDAKIQIYFAHGNERRLLNRYMSDDDAGSVSIKLNNGYDYSISADPVEININKHTDTTIKESNIASDFISYKLLSKLYDFKHGDNIDLFELFEADIFDYMPYSTTLTYMDEWQALKRVENNPPRKNSWAYTSFIGRVEQFNKSYKDFIESIKQDVNDLLANYFSTSYEVIINYRDTYYHDVPRLRKERKIKSPQILITIKLTANGLSDRNSKVNQPHTFLNEAKLTAIALSIRLAILRTRVTGRDILKILVLDDLLISLDMSNRDIVVNMLLEDEYLKDYQIIMLTHDRAFYERSKQIFDYKAKGEWKYFEMYVEPHETKDIEIPYIKEFGQEYGNKERAEEHFRKRDYPAAANYLRKEVEKLYYKNLDLGKLESIMELSRKVDNYEKIETCFPILMKTLKAFKNCKNIPDKEVRAKKCIIFADKVEKAFDAVYEIIKSDEFFDVGLMKDHILNPQSHDDFTKPLYKKELEDALKGVESLQQAVEKNILNRMVKKRIVLKNKQKISRRRNKR
jgi:energy-coupling factor transporter ATP-binding protein EcfA2